MYLVKVFLNANKDFLDLVLFNFLVYEKVSNFWYWAWVLRRGQIDERIGA